MLTRTAVVIPLGADATALAQRLAAEGATVVLVTDESEEARTAAGVLAAELAATGKGRPAVFAAPGTDALVEFLGELFRA